MSQVSEPGSPQAPQQPTVLETDLDLVCSVLGRIKSKLDYIPLQEHLTDGEQHRLSAALDRAEHELHELADRIRQHA